jgi:uncharacterized protein (TIGR00369 family)
MNPIVTFLQTQLDQVTQGPSVVGNWLAGSLRKVAPGEIEIEYTVRKDMINPAQTLHGGMAAMILDEIIGMTAFSLYTEVLYTSINLQVDFLRPARLGDKLLASARVVRQGKQVIHLEADIRRADGKIIAKGSSNMARTSTPNGFFTG